MKRLKVVIVTLKRPPNEPPPTGQIGRMSKLVDADTGEEVECVRDFRMNVPMDGVITVDAELLVAEVETIPSDGFVKSYVEKNHERLRRTGRTTAGMLLTIAKAISEPGETFTFVDHYPSDHEDAIGYAHDIRHYCDLLELKRMAVWADGVAVNVRSDFLGIKCLSSC